MISESANEREMWTHSIQYDREVGRELLKSILKIFVFKIFETRRRIIEGINSNILTSIRKYKKYKCRVQLNVILRITTNRVQLVARRQTIHQKIYESVQQSLMRKFE